MIRPHFDYGDYIIDSGIQSKIEKMERIQDRIIRTFEYKHNVEERDDIDKLKTRYNIENLYIRRKKLS